MLWNKRLRCAYGYQSDDLPIYSCLPFSSTNNININSGVDEKKIMKDVKKE